MHAIYYINALLGDLLVMANRSGRDEFRSELVILNAKLGGDTGDKM